MRTVFKLFRPKPSVLPPEQPSSAITELRGATLESYHFALRLERDDRGEARRLIGWHGSSKGGARVDLRRDSNGMWRDPQGRQAEVADDLVPPTIRLSAAWAAQWRPTGAEKTSPDQTEHATQPLTVET